VAPAAGSPPGEDTDLVRTDVFIRTPDSEACIPTRSSYVLGMASAMLETRLGPVAWRSSGQGPALVFFAGALANGALWRDVVGALEDRCRCITIDLPLGAHPVPPAAGADRSAPSLARLLLDCLDLLDLEDATVVANDTGGGCCSWRWPPTIRRSGA
jgi:hypothetical protein